MRPLDILQTARPGKRERWLPSLLGLLLVLGQLALVLHETGHALDPASDSCPICRVAAHSGDAPPASAALPLPPVPAAAPPALPAGPAPLARPARPTARGPPPPQRVIG